MSDEQKVRLAETIVDFIEEYDFYDWEDAENPELQNTSSGWKMTRKA